MDPILAAASAIVAILATKALETTGEKLGEEVIKRSSKVLESLRHKSPNTVKLLEDSSAKELDYAQVIETIKNEADKDPQLAQLLEELALEVQNDSNGSKFISPFISQKPTVYNAGKLADCIKNVFQGNTIIGGNF